MTGYGLALLEEAATTMGHRVCVETLPVPHACHTIVWPGAHQTWCTTPGCRYEACADCGWYVSYGDHHPTCPTLRTDWSDSHDV